MADETTATPAGWYEHRDMHNTLRFWDGEDWTDQTAPAPASGPGVLTIARGVALGMAAVFAAVWIIYGVAHSNDGVQCATDNVNRAELGLPLKDCG